METVITESHFISFIFSHTFLFYFLKFVSLFFSTRLSYISYDEYVIMD
jgi:hypothetical protein